MSKNFELMQEALREAQRESPSNSRSESVVFVEPEADRRDQPAPSDFDSVAQQECFKLVQRVFLGKPSRAIVFAGVDSGDGCSRICVEAARILASNTSRSVCLVDANFHKPSLAKFFNVLDDGGFAKCLVERGPVRTVATQLTSNLWLLSGKMLKPGSQSLLNTESLAPRFQEIRKEFDYILVDAPALNSQPDALTLGRITDGAVVVLQADSTRRGTALKALESLRDASIEVLGAVLNRRTFPIPAFVYNKL